MRSKLFWFYAMPLVCLALSAQADGRTYAKVDFSNGTPGQTPPVTASPPAGQLLTNATVAVEATGNLPGGLPGTGTVRIAYTFTNSTQTATFGDGNVLVVHDSITNATYPYVYFALPASDAVTSGVLNIDFDLMTDDLPGASGSFNIALHNAAAYTSSSRMGLLSVSAITGNIRFYSYSAVGSIGSFQDVAAVPRAVKAHLRIELNHDTGIYSLYHNGTLRAATNFPAGAGFRTLSFTGANSLITRFALDNLTLQRPLQGTLVQIQ